MTASLSMSRTQDSLSDALASFKAPTCEPLKARSLAALLAASPSTAPSRINASASTAASTADGGDESDSDWSCSSASSRPGAFRGVFSKLQSPACRRRSDDLSTDSGDESSYLPSSTFDESGDDSSQMPWDDCASVMSLDQDDASDFISCGKGDELDEKDGHGQTGGSQNDGIKVAKIGQLEEAIVTPVMKLELCPAIFPTDILILPEAPPEVTDADGKRVVRLTRAALDVAHAAQKFEPAYDRLVRGLRTNAQLAVALGEVMEKAIWENGMIPVCVDLLLRLRWDGRLSQTIAPDGSPDGFRQTMLNRCWPLLQEICRTPPSLVAQVVPTSRRQLGAVKLLGALIARGALSPRLAIEGAEALLRADALEPLAELLQATGPKLDGWKGWVHAARFARVFRQVREKLASTATPIRERAFLQDLCVLQDARWCSQNNSSAAAALRRAALHGPPGLELRTGSAKSTPPAVAVAKGFTNLARSVFAAPSMEPQAGTAHHCARGSGGVSDLKKVLRGPLSAASTSADDGDPSPAHSVLAPVVARNLAWQPDQEKMVAPPPPSPAPPAFSPAAFRRELSALLADLRVDSNVATAVRRVRAQAVPPEHQESQYIDVLTRACEYSYKPARRTAFAFAAGLAAARPSAFDRSACLAGIRIFFQDVYADLCEEVPKLPIIVRVEMLPTLRSVFSPAVIDKLVPKDLLES